MHTAYATRTFFWIVWFPCLIRGLFFFLTYVNGHDAILLRVFNLDSRRRGSVFVIARGYIVSKGRKGENPKPWYEVENRHFLLVQWLVGKSTVLCTMLFKYCLNAGLWCCIYVCLLHKIMWEVLCAHQNLYYKGRRFSYQLRAKSITLWIVHR